jgi:hypothetical protein
MVSAVRLPPLTPTSQSQLCRTDCAASAWPVPEKRTGFAQARHRLLALWQGTWASSVKAQTYRRASQWPVTVGGGGAARRMALQKWHLL